MNAHQMITAISETLAEGEVVRIRVTEARGYTYIRSWDVTREGYTSAGEGYARGAGGNLRAEYRRRVLGR
jgi:hypothetical protein